MTKTINSKCGKCKAENETSQQLLAGIKGTKQALKQYPELIKLNDEEFVLVDEDIVFWAFRYALGRKTGAVYSVVSNLERVWENLSDHTKLCIQNEIRKSIRQDSAGDRCDVDMWSKLL